MNGRTFSLFWGGFAHATLDSDRKTMSEHRHVISIKSEGCVQDDWTIAWGIRFNYKGFKAKTLMPVVFAKKVLERHLLHNRGYSRTCEERVK